MAMRKLWNTLGGSLQKTTYQKKALDKFEEVASGEKILAPKHPTDQKHFDVAQKNDAIAEMISRKDDGLVERVGQMNINANELPDKAVSSRSLPTRESEFARRDDPEPKFGYQEITLDKMEPNTVMFREVYEILNMYVDAEENNSFEHLEQHKGFQRLSADKRERLFHYFRPFVRKEKQLVVEKRDLEVLVEYMRNRTEEFTLEQIRTEAVSELRAIMRKGEELSLPDPELERARLERKRHQTEYSKRLDARLSELSPNQLDKQ